MKKWWFIGESAALAVLDQSLKSYVEQNIKPGEEKHLTERVVLRNVKNRGMCMNLLQENPKAVKICSVFAALALTAAQTVTLFRKGYFFRKKGFALLLAGACLLLYGFGIAGALRLGAALAVLLLAAVWVVGLVKLRPAGFAQACRQAVTTTE